MTFDQNLPIIIGLVGEAGTGKDSVADYLVPLARSGALHEEQTVFDRIAFAQPLKRMATARQKISGYKAADRTLYDIHTTLVELLGNSPLYGAPDYDDLISMTRKIFSLSCEPDGDKPRKFLQEAADICKTHSENCFVIYAKLKMQEMYRQHLYDHKQNDEIAPPFVVIVTDVRLMSEATMISAQPNGLLIRLSAEPNARIERIQKRDGWLDPKRLGHFTEMEIAKIDPMMYNLIIDTTDMIEKEVCEQVYEFIQQKLQGASVNA